MAKQPDPNQMAKSWQQGMASGQQKFVAAIQRVTVNPMALAADAVDSGKWAAAVAAAAPRMSANLRSADPSFWKSQTAGAGGAAWAAGAAKGLPKYTRQAQKLAAAAAAGSLAASQTSGALAKVQANINAFRTAFGKPTI